MVRILKDLDAAIEGRDVLIVEDIVDSGLTLSYLLRNLQARGPASLEVCALLTKPERREVDLPTRYVGFEIPDKFAIGYGLDHAKRIGTCPSWPRYGKSKPSNRAKPPGSLHLVVSRFLKSALFPILIVIVLAFFASKLIQPGRIRPRRALVRRLPGAGREGPGPVGDAEDRRTTRSRSCSRTEKKYQVGYPTHYSRRLVNQLRAAEDEGNIRDFDVKPRGRT